MNSSIKLLALIPVLIVSVSCGGGSGSPSGGVNGGGANLYTIYESASGAQATIPGEAVQLTFGNDTYWAYSGTVYNPYGSQSSRTDTTDSSTAKYADSTMATPANWTQQLTPPTTSPYYSFCYHLTPQPNISLLLSPPRLIAKRRLFMQTPKQLHLTTR